MNVTYPLPTHQYSLLHLSPLPSLALNRLLLHVGATIVGLFFPIFIFELLGSDLWWYFGWMAAMYLIRAPLHITAARVFSRTGLRWSMMFACATYAAFFGVIVLIDTFPWFHPIALFAFASALLTVFSIFYWAPFHIDFAAFSTKGKRGEQVSMLYAAQIILSVLGPLLGGFLISKWSYGAAFACGIIGILFSLAPLRAIPKTPVRYEWGFLETLGKLCDLRFRALVVSMVAFGVETSIGGLVWPIFLFLMFKGAYLDIGVFAAAIVVIDLVLTLGVGRLVDRSRPRRILKHASRVYALGWIAKSMVSTIGGLFAATTFHTLGSAVLSTPLDMLLYEKVADAGHYVDEFTVLREVAIGFGRGLTCAALMLLTAWFPLAWSFVLAAVASLLLGTFARFHVAEGFGLR